jgi:hypothetical protein
MTIQENTFAAACYDQNSITDLVRALHDGPDPADMAEWNIDAEEWREQIEMALVAKREDILS